MSCMRLSRCISDVGFPVTRDSIAICALGGVDSADGECCGMGPMLNGFEAGSASGPACVSSGSVPVSAVGRFGAEGA